MMYLSISPRTIATLRVYALSFGLFLCGYAIAQNTEMDQLTQARAAITKQDWVTAEALLQKLVRSQPKNPFVFYDLAQVYESTNRTDAAKKIYQDLTSNADLAKSQPTMVIRAPYASRMVSLLSLAQARLNAIEARQLAAAPPVPPLPPKVLANNPPELVKPKSLPLPIAATPSADIPLAISAAMTLWIEAWTRKDLQAYYASYVSNYRGDFPTPESWRLQRQTNITRAKTISLDLTNVEMTTVSPTNVQVRFTQNYASNIVQNKVRKTLFFVLRNGQWLIELESTK